jgi:hypothetical protein
MAAIAYRTLYSELLDCLHHQLVGFSNPSPGRHVAGEPNGPRSGHGEGQVVPATELDARRKLVSRLVEEAGLARPPEAAGQLLKAIADEGFFESGGVLAGPMAFYAYPAILGVPAPAAVSRKLEEDYAANQKLLLIAAESVPSLRRALKKVDASFLPVPPLVEQAPMTRYLAQSGQLVEVLPPDKPLGRAILELPGGLSFLIEAPVPAVLLHDAGVPLLVPAPARYAVHKLIASSLSLSKGLVARNGSDAIAQAEFLLGTLLEVGEGASLARAFKDAWNRGDAWQDALSKGLAKLPADYFAPLRAALGADGVMLEQGYALA